MPCCYVYKPGKSSVHIQRFTKYGRPLMQSLCGRKGLKYPTFFSPRAAFQKTCGSCELIYDRERSKGEE